mmetsp:Transcript_3443/g.5245  ORF Transcript_3443/g.5245 Transcript_3443/m.5245 type:complete len:80 (-) Transcript_3443:384-623(-)
MRTFRGHIGFHYELLTNMQQNKTRSLKTHQTLSGCLSPGLPRFTPILSSITMKRKANIIQIGVIKIKYHNEPMQRSNKS